MSEVVVGDVVRMASFSSHVVTEFGDVTFSYKQRKKMVAVFLYLGIENKDGSEPLDLRLRMKQLGWMPIP
jgi:hypothetical protein